jgi:hypothetical protein
VWYLLLRPSGGEASGGDSPNLLPRGLHDSETDPMASWVLGFPKSKDCSLFMRDDAISSSSSHLLPPVCSCGKDIGGWQQVCGGNGRDWQPPMSLLWSSDRRGFNFMLDSRGAVQRG